MRMRGMPVLRLCAAAAAGASQHSLAQTTSSGRRKAASSTMVSMQRCEILQHCCAVMLPWMAAGKAVLDMQCLTAPSKHCDVAEQHLQGAVLAMSAASRMKPAVPEESHKGLHLMPSNCPAFENCLSFPDVIADFALCLQLLTNHGPLTARPVDHIFQKPSRVHKIPAHHENDDD